MNCRRSQSRCTVEAQRGFSFLELLAVMGSMAVLMGLTVGYLGNVGKGSEMAQAIRLLRETGIRAVNASVGNQRSFLTVSQASEDEALMLKAGIARNVLTHQMEMLEFASGARTPAVTGNVKIAEAKGHTGNGALFVNGTLELGAESRYAPTEGLQYEVWIQPEASRSTMSLLRGTSPSDEMIYDVELVRNGDAPSYDVRFRVLVRKSTESVRVKGDYKVFESTGAPVAADGSAWVHVAINFDGGEAQILVSGHPVPMRDASASSLDSGKKDDGALQIAIPVAGIIKLSLGTGFRGVMDSVILRGVFRSTDYEIELPDRMSVIFPKLPIRIEYVNGRIAGRGSADVVIWVRDEAHPTDMPLRLTYGRAGTVEAKYMDRVAPTKSPQGTNAEAGGGS